MAGYIGAPKVPVRVYSPSTKAYLYTSSEIKRRVYTAEGTSADADQWFTVEPDQASSQQVLFKSNNTGQWVSLERSETSTLIFTYPNRDNDKKLLLEAGTNSRAGQFRIFCPFSRLYAVATSDKPPGVIKSAAGEGDNAWWQFVYRDPILVGLTYKTDQGSIQDSSPLPLNTQTFDVSDQNAQYTFVTKKSVEHTSLWKLSGNFQFPGEISGKVGVPDIVRGKIVVRTAPSLSFRFYEPLRYSKEWNESFALIVPSETQAQGAASVTKSSFEVPFLAKFQVVDGGNGTDYEIPGTYQGTTTYDYKLSTDYIRLKDRSEPQELAG